MIRGQISVDMLRQDIAAAEQVCAIVVVEDSGLIELVGADSESVAEVLESRGFSRDASSGDGSSSDSPIIFQALTC